MSVEHPVDAAQPAVVATPLIGCSIHRWAVAVDAECVTVVSAFSFSSAEISPGG